MILVFGSLNADLFFTVKNLPVSGETSLSPHYKLYPGGKGANQAVAASQAGAVVKMIGCVGNDTFSDPILHNLKSFGIDVSGVTQSLNATGVAVVMVDSRGENQIVVASGANKDIVYEQISQEDLCPSNILLLQMEVPIEQIEKAIYQAKTANCRIIMNFAPAGIIDEKALRACNVLVLNAIEANALTGAKNDPTNQVRRISNSYDLDCIITLGGRGGILCTGDTLFRIEALDVDVVDSVGAGDAFVGCLAASLDSGVAIYEAFHRATVAAGLACLNEGAQTQLPSMRQIDENLVNLAPPTKIND